MQEACKDSKFANQCTLEEFKTGMRKFVIPAKYQEDDVLTCIFDGCKENEDDIRMNYKNLVDKLIDSKDQNNFFNFKDVIILIL